MLYKHILPEEINDLVCPLCKHPLKHKGGIGHMSAFCNCEHMIRTRMFFCDHCHLRVMLPVKVKRWGS